MFGGSALTHLKHATQLAPKNSNLAPKQPDGSVTSSAWATSISPTSGVLVPRKLKAHQRAIMEEIVERSNRTDEMLAQS
jgi:hypothetical protein